MERDSGPHRRLRRLRPLPDICLADLFDPLTMPPDLTKAHQALDRAVDRLYRKKPFPSDKERLEFLFERYRELVDQAR